jgi:hypothetical protein
MHHICTYTYIHELTCQEAQQWLILTVAEPALAQMARRSRRTGLSIRVWRRARLFGSVCNCMHVCVCVYIYIYIYVCMSIYRLEHSRMAKSPLVWQRVQLHVCVYVCVQTSGYTCIHTQRKIASRVPRGALGIHTYTHTYADIQKYTKKRTLCTIQSCRTVRQVFFGMYMYVCTCINIETTHGLHDPKL